MGFRVNKNPHVSTRVCLITEVSMKMLRYYEGNGFNLYLKCLGESDIVMVSDYDNDEVLATI